MNGTSVTNILFASVKEIKDQKKFIVSFEIPGLISGAEAYPIQVFDEPKVGDTIIVFQIDSIFGGSYVYQKMRQLDFTRTEQGNSKIEVKNAEINIKADKITIEANNIQITDGTVVPNTKGPFCSIPVCPFTGVEHAGNISIK